MVDRDKDNEEGLISMSLGDHLDELRSRLILAMSGLAVAILIALAAGKWFLKIILLPYQTAMESLNIDAKLQAFDPAEPFMVYLKAVLVLAVLISSPWLFYQLWAFISAGLYKNERRFVRVVAPASAILFVVGVMFFLLAIAPSVFTFFMGFDSGIDYMTYQPGVNKTVNFVLTLALVFGLAFQTPIAIVFAERMGLVTLKTLCGIRKYAFLAAFVVGAIATPSPDVISMLALSIPLYILYECGILVSRIWRKKRKV